MQQRAAAADGVAGERVAGLEGDAHQVGLEVDGPRAVALPQAGGPAPFPDLAAVADGVGVARLRPGDAAQGRPSRACRSRSAGTRAASPGRACGARPCPRRRRRSPRRRPRPAGEPGSPATASSGRRKASGWRGELRAAPARVTWIRSRVPASQPSSGSRERAADRVDRRRAGARLAREALAVEAQPRPARAGGARRRAAAGRSRRGARTRRPATRSCDSRGRRRPRGRRRAGRSRSPSRRGRSASHHDPVTLPWAMSKCSVTLPAAAPWRHEPSSQTPSGVAVMPCAG